MVVIFFFIGRVNITKAGSGLFGSWSWNTSNFHIDDTMDGSYTDKNHKPIYSLDHLPNSLVEVHVPFLLILSGPFAGSEPKVYFVHGLAGPLKKIRGMLAS